MSESDPNPVSGGLIAFGLVIGSAIGSALGTAFGAMTGDLAIWVAMGVPIGSGLGLTAAIIYGVMIAERNRRDICQACGYSTKKLPSTVCPECGADLSKQHDGRGIADEPSS